MKALIILKDGDPYFLEVPSAFGGEYIEVLDRNTLVARWQDTRPVRAVTLRRRRESFARKNGGEHLFDIYEEV